LLPSIEMQLPPSARPTGMPSYGVSNPGVPTIGELSLTHPVETLDPQLLGEELSYQIGTNQM